MNRLERFYKIDQLLQDRKVVSRDDFLSILEVSLATFKRDLEYPIVTTTRATGSRIRHDRDGDIPAGTGRTGLRPVD